MAVPWYILEWQFHFGCHRLIEAIDKNAHVYVLVKANMMHGMTDENVRELKEHFGLS